MNKLLTDNEIQEVKYTSLTHRGKETYNFYIVAEKLSKYGFDCMRIMNDYKGADFFAIHAEKQKSFPVQLKARLTIDEKYRNKEIIMAFPLKGTWYFIPHDVLYEIIRDNANYLETSSWTEEHLYHTDRPNVEVIQALEPYIL